MNRTRLLTIAALTPCICAPHSWAGPRANFFVSPAGHDGWSGRLEAPNRARTDGPFATLTQAVRSVRHFRQQNPALKRPVTVLVRGGFYGLSEPIRITPEDSGHPGSPTRYAAYPGELPILSGGRRLTGWTVDNSGRWSLRIREAADGNWRFQQLFVNGARRYRPRLPKQGYHSIAEGLPPSPAAQNQGADRFRFKEGEISADWHDLSGVEVLGFQTWTMARMRVKSVEPSERIVNFTGTTRGLAHYSLLPTGNRYLIENVREALTEPGEFYLDAKTGVLTYIPLPGEHPKRTEVVAPRLESLLEIRGDLTERKWVSHVQFLGLTFAHTNWVTPAEGNAFPQAEVNLGGAVNATGARDCSFNRCRIVHTGTYGLELGEGCKRVSFSSGEMSDLGAGGVKIGLMSAPEDDERVASHNTIEGCLIAHGGRLHPAGIGVWVGHSHHNRIAVNEIADFYYTGISVGWSWGYGRSLAHHNTLERNHIHDIGQGVLSDMGGIYTLGLSPGTVERGNRIHDVDSFDYGGWGIYTDEGSTGILIEKNVVFRTKSAGFHQHYGKENVVRNNVFAFGRTAQLMRSREEEHLSFTFERNIVYWKTGGLLGNTWANGNFKLDRNLYFQADGKPIDFAGASVEAWRGRGMDSGSQVSDPHFVRPDQGDFRLKPSSPAFKLGFEPIDDSVASPPRRSRPLAPPAFPPVKGK